MSELVNSEITKKLAKKVIEEMAPKPIEWSTLRKVLHSIRDSEKQTVDSESLAYSPTEYPFTKEEFKKVFRWIEEYAERVNKQITVKKGTFPEYETRFQFEGTTYLWNVLIGQGSITTISVDNKKKARFTMMEEPS